MTLPNIQLTPTSQAALDVESFIRDVARKYALTTAEQLYVLTLVMKTQLKLVIDAEHKNDGI